MHRPTLSKATFSAALAAISVLTLSCVDSSGPPRTHELAFYAVFGGGTSGVVPLDFVRVTLTRPNDGTLVLDTVIQIPEGADSLPLTLTVPVGSNPETFLLLLEFVTPAGRVAWVGGPVEVSTSTGAPVSIDIELRYTGVGFDAADVEISRLMLAVGVDETITLTAMALDSSSNQILGTPKFWSSLDPDIADVPDETDSTVVGVNPGSARIVATLLTGQADTVTVAVPNDIVVVSGDNQTQQVGEDLDEPIVVQVLSNSDPVPDVYVRFEVTSGGGILSPESVLTDAQGTASAIWTLGPDPETQTGGAAVVGVPGLEVTFSATGQSLFADEIVLVSGDNQTQQVGEDLDEPIVVQVLSNSDPVPDVYVRFEVTSGGGMLSPDSVLTDAQGMAFAIWTLGPDLGTQTGMASVVGVSELEVTFTATGQPQPTPGRDVVVFNDINVFDETAMLDDNNKLLVRNLVDFTATGPRANGTIVWTDNGRSSSCSFCNRNSFFTMFDEIESLGLAVVEMPSTSGSITDIPSDVKAIFFWNLQEEFTVDEINVLKAFAEEGGRIIYIGEHEGFLGAQGIVVENQFLLDMGAVMTNTGGLIDCGRVVAGASQLREHQVTTGLDSLQMGCASEIVPGEQDFAFLFDMTNTVVIAGVAKVDVTPLPAPTAAVREARRQRFVAEVDRLRQTIQQRSSSATGTGAANQQRR